MFHTLESTWDQSARRGWTTAASFTMQALALSLLLVVPLFTIEGPPRLAWFGHGLIAPPAAPPAPVPAPQPGQHAFRTGIVVLPGFYQPPRIPHGVTQPDNVQVFAAPDLGEIGVTGGTGSPGQGDRLLRMLSEPGRILPPPAPVPTHPIRISHWAEGNLIHRVQPVYPPLAIAARVQGTVVLRAIVSKSGTIENLAVVSGPGMLMRAAVDAVRQWRYRPYLLNGEPVEVDTEITVNFTLSGN